MSIFDRNITTSLSGALAILTTQRDWQDAAAGTSVFVYRHPVHPGWYKCTKSERDGLYRPVHKSSHYPLTRRPKKPFPKPSKAPPSPGETKLLLVQKWANSHLQFCPHLHLGPWLIDRAWNKYTWGRVHVEGTSWYNVEPDTWFPDPHRLDAAEHAFYRKLREYDLTDDMIEIDIDHKAAAYYQILPHGVDFIYKAHIMQDDTMYTRKGMIRTFVTGLVQKDDQLPLTHLSGSSMFDARLVDKIVQMI